MSHDDLSEYGYDTVSIHCTEGIPYANGLGTPEGSNTNVIACWGNTVKAPTPEPLPIARVVLRKRHTR